MIKKVVLILTLCLFAFAVNAQEENVAKRTKYITKAPDGSTSMIIYDDSRSNSLEFESTYNFYKYQLVDMNSGEPVYSFNHKGKRAVLNKSKVADGDYELRVFTKKFVVTSHINISKTKHFIQSRAIVASSEN